MDTTSMDTSALQSGSGQDAQQAGGASMQSEDDGTLFGNTYDLTEAENLLEREPSSTDDAEDLLDQLTEMKETVEEQYAELLRNRKATELGIQYTYDSAVLAGRLAEVTYEQECAEIEQTLQDAKDELSDLEEQQALLAELSDGVVTAKEAGSVAAVNVAADDILTSWTAMYSTYETDTVEIPLEISQNEIARLHVGDTVDVTLTGYGTLEGVISEKAAEALSGTSRTTVNYEVDVELSNTTGRLTSGLAATVSVASESEEADHE
jgi:multidrug resistance efflux pump